MTTGSSVLVSDSESNGSSHNGAVRLEANHHRRHQQQAGDDDHDKTEDTPMILANNNDADVTTVMTTASCTADTCNGYVRRTQTSLYYVCV